MTTIIQQQRNPAWYDYLNSAITKTGMGYYGGVKEREEEQRKYQYAAGLQRAKHMAELLSDPSKIQEMKLFDLISKGAPVEEINKARDDLMVMKGQARPGEAVTADTNALAKLAPQLGNISGARARGTEEAKINVEAENIGTIADTTRKKSKASEEGQIDAKVTMADSLDILTARHARASAAGKALGEYDVLPILRKTVTELKTAETEATIQSRKKNKDALKEIEDTVNSWAQNHAELKERVALTKSITTILEAGWLQADQKKDQSYMDNAKELVEKILSTMNMQGPTVMGGQRNTVMPNVPPTITWKDTLAKKGSMPLNDMTDVTDSLLHGLK